MKLLLLLSSMLLISACASLKKIDEPKIEKSVTVQVPFDKAWTEVISYFSEKGIPVKTLEKASGLISTEDMSFQTVTDSKLFVCDKYKFGGKEPVFPGIAKFNVFVRKVNDKETSVQVNTFASATMNILGPTYNSMSLKCYSTGEHERMLFERLKSLK